MLCDTELGQVLYPICGHLRPSLRLFPDELLQGAHITRAWTLDEIGTERVRRTYEAEYRNVDPLHQDADRLEIERECLTRLERPQRSHICCRSDWSIDHGSRTLAQFELEARGEEGRREVVVENRGVEGVVVERKRRDLRGGLGVTQYVEERALVAQGPVARERAAGLSHQPDRSTIYGLAPKCSQ